MNIASTNKEIGKLAARPPVQAFSSSTTNDWATLDKTMMVKDATEAPFLNGVITSFFSRG